MGSGSAAVVEFAADEDVAVGVIDEEEMVADDIIDFDVDVDVLVINVLKGVEDVVRLEDCRIDVSMRTEFIDQGDESGTYDNSPDICHREYWRVNRLNR